MCPFKGIMEFSKSDIGNGFLCPILWNDFHGISKVEMRQGYKQTIYLPTHLPKGSKQTVYSPTHLSKCSKHTVYLPTHLPKGLKQTLYLPTYLPKWNLGDKPIYIRVVRFAHAVGNPLGQYRFKPTNTWKSSTIRHNPSCA
jgi:hypothetical protein